MELQLTEPPLSSQVDFQDGEEEEESLELRLLRMHPQDTEE
jgi:hypothetical protein